MNINIQTLWCPECDTFVISKRIEKQIYLCEFGHRCGLVDKDGNHVDYSHIVISKADIVKDVYQLKNDIAYVQRDGKPVKETLKRFRVIEEKFC